MPRRSYQHYCTIGRALDVVGDRWSLLIVRELCGGARRYSDLFADLPGISTDVLAARLRDLESDGIVVHRRGGPRANAARYELTERGQQLQPVLAALADWGVGLLGERGEKDAVRAHWLAIPLGAVLHDHLATGVVNVRIGGEPPFHFRLGPDGVTQCDDLATDADADLNVDFDVALAMVRGERDVSEELTTRR